MMSSLPPGFVLEKTKLPEGFVLEDPKAPKFEQDAFAGARVVSDIVRPVAQGVFGGLGAVAGFGAPIPGGSVIGGGLGYAFGSELADMLDNLLNIREKRTLPVELKEAGGRVAWGAAEEASGQILFGGLSPLVGAALEKLPSFTKSGMEKQAGRTLASHTERTPMETSAKQYAPTESGTLIAKNQEEARLLEETIPGLRFSRGQSTDNADIIKFERNQARGQTGAATDQLEMAAGNSRAIQDYVNKVKGEGGITDVTDELTKQQTALDQRITNTTQKMDVETGKLGAGQSGMDSGKEIRFQAKEGEKQNRIHAGELFDKVPQFKIDASSILTKIDELSKPFDEFEIPKKSIPADFAHSREVLTKTGGMTTPNGLQGLRRNLGDSLRDLEGSANPNKRMEMRLKALIGEVDSVMYRASREGGMPGTATFKQPGKPSPVVESPTYRGDHEAPSPDYGAPGHNLAQDIYPDDVYSKNAARYYGHGESALDKTTVRLYSRIKDKPEAEIKIYRAVPPEYKDSQIVEGDWVTINKGYAIQHGESALNGDFEIIETTAKAKEIYTNGDSFHEWGYWPEEKPDIPLKEGTSNQSTYKGDIIYPQELKDELSEVNKRIAAQPQAKQVLDVDKTYKELYDAKEIGIMEQVREGKDAYGKRLAKSYKRKFGKDAPIIETKKKGATGLEERKAEIETILRDSKEIKMSDMQAAASKLKTAQQYFKKEVIESFQQGSVNDILKKGQAGHTVSDAQVVSKFFKSGELGVESAQQFKRAVGNNKNASKALKEAIRQDLYSQVNPSTEELTEKSLYRWLGKYKGALKELNILDDFKDIVSARKQLDKALENKAVFEKSEAAKLLGYDLDASIRKTFTDGKEKQVAAELMKKLGKNKKAVKGLQNAIVDSIIGNAKTSSADLLGGPASNLVEAPFVKLSKIEDGFEKYNEALKVVYKDSPEKLKSLRIYRDARKRMQIGVASPLGGGSDSAEHLLTEVSKLGGLAPSRWVNVAKTLFNVVQKLPENHINNLLNRAAFDPDFAHTLVTAANGMPIDKVVTRLKANFATIGVKPFKIGTQPFDIDVTPGQLKGVGATMGIRAISDEEGRQDAARGLQNKLLFKGK